MAQTLTPTAVERDVTDAIEVARRIRRRSVLELCAAAGIGRASYYNRLAGTAEWKLRELIFIAAALEIPLPVLLDGPAATRDLLTCTKCQPPLVRANGTATYGNPAKTAVKQLLAAA